MKTNFEDIIIFYMRTTNHDHMMCDSSDMVRDGRTEGRTNGRTEEQTEKVTYRGNCPT